LVPLNKKYKTFEKISNISIEGNNEGGFIKEESDKSEKE